MTDVAELTLSADRGDGAAALRLAVLSGLGLGRPRDRGEAIALLEPARAAMMTPSPRRRCWHPGAARSIWPPGWPHRPGP